MSSGQHGMPARRRVVVAGAVGVVAGAASAPFVEWSVVPLVVWDVAAIVFVVWVWLVVRRLDAEETARHAEQEDPTRPAADFILLTAAVTSLVAVGAVIIRARGAGGAAQFVQVGFGVASVLLSWAVIHTVYMLRYAKIYYTDEDGGVEFHGDAAPRFSDFAYLAFTVGMTYQVSDPEVQTPEFRAQILRHSLLSYLFGTVILAVTINLVAGLGR